LTTLLLVNPAAGRGRGGRLKLRAEAACRQYWSDLAVEETAGPGDGVRLARFAAEAGVERLLVLGGDGTVHEAANGLLQATVSQRPPLGVLPVGTGNDYAKLTGLGGAGPEQAARRLSRGRIRRLDAGRVGETFFVNALGVGFDAEVARRVNCGRLQGPVAYLVAVAQTYRSFSPLEIAVVVESGRFEETALLVEVGIGAVVGGGFRLNPAARPDDGEFDVCVIRKLSLGEFVTRLPLAILGWHTRLRQVRAFRSPRVTLESLAGPVLAHLDGEVRTMGPRLEIVIEPQCLSVICA
jgi:diacylglycerol kinase (ATP)